MAKGEGRGFWKYLPSIPLIVRVLVALVVLRLVLRTAGASVPASIGNYLPNL